MTDFVSLPFYDLFHENEHGVEIRRKLPSLLSGVRRSILEIGAGTGLITTSLADSTPAEIFALEPSAGMRGMLLSRLNARAELLERVTVLSCDALSLDLDEPVEAMVMIRVMYALEPDYRRRLWPVLAAHLEPGGLLIFTWRDGGPPAPSPLRELESRQVVQAHLHGPVGDHRVQRGSLQGPLPLPGHRGRQGAQRGGDRRQRLPSWAGGDPGRAGHGGFRASGRA
ncbi:class I SAM-dependent methyltransferase [Nonomuraea ferruginea]